LALGLDMTPLLEVHNKTELDRALTVDPVLIGINNRDLKTFDVDLNTTRRLAACVPDGIALVAESGVFTGADVRAMGASGADAVLVGEALVKAPDIAAAVRELSRQPKEANA
jgi:indole-3-glycerol phosphate synthase